MEIRNANKTRVKDTQLNQLIWVSTVNFPAYLINKFMNLLINIPVMNTVWRERRELKSLTLDKMRDMGIDPMSVEAECKRSFFDIPNDRRKYLDL